MILLPLLARASVLLSLLSLVEAKRGFPINSRRSAHRGLVQSRAEAVEKKCDDAAAPTFPKTRSGKEMISSAWYAGWHGYDTDFPPEEMSWEKYNVVAYAFALTTEKPGDIDVSDDDKPILKEVVKRAHAVGTKVTLSVGGWTGSIYWSTSVGNSHNRTLFINKLTKLVKLYNLDGLDFDWEYPNNQGLGCNVISKYDSVNFYSFLHDLRASPYLKKTALLTADTSIVPFNGLDGNPLEEVSKYAKYLDWIHIMNYDIWGNWMPTAGPNSPLNDTCVIDPDNNQIGSAVSAVQAWNSAGFPLDQIVLGVAAYGHSFSVEPKDAYKSYNKKTGTGSGGLKNSYPVFNTTFQPWGDAWDGAGLDPCGVDEPPSGDYDFWGLVFNGFLDKTGKAAKGIDYMYDSCSQTPSVYNAKTQMWIEYDDATSFAAKGQFVKNTGLRGFAMWEAGGDYDDMLLDSILTGAGYCPHGGCTAPPNTRTYPTTTYSSTSSTAVASTSTAKITTSVKHR